MRTAIPNAELALYSFGRLGKVTSPCSAQYYIDVSNLRDPMSNRGFKKNYKDGRAGEVQDFMKDDPRVEAIFDMVRMIAHISLRAEATSGSNWLSFAFKDHHGIWTAPAVVEIIADRLSNIGYRVAVFHHELENQS